MSRSSQEPQPSKGNQFIHKWENNPYETRFEFWSNFLEQTHGFFKEKFKTYEADIENFEEKYSEAAGESGLDHYFDDIIPTQQAYNRILPLAFVGAYNDFERYLITLVSSIKVDLPSLPNFNKEKLEDIKRYLERHIGVFDADLEAIYARIDANRLYRNVIAHNDYKVSGNREEILEKIDVKVISGVIQPLKNTSILTKSLLDYDRFVDLILEKVAAKLDE